jgi:hypothetical protein
MSLAISLIVYLLRHRRSLFDDCVCLPQKLEALRCPITPELLTSHHVTLANFVGDLPFLQPASAFSDLLPITCQQLS